ncbi:MAG: 23S rRNA (adenine2503-C2)-methyltransferase [Alphaproteobacteria bacterium]|jgi:23S rRNA (adenine2503-C2)-methyltransferase
MSLPSSLIGLSRSELKSVLSQLNIPEKMHNMRVTQLWSAIYTQGHQSIGDITTLSKPFRETLSEHHHLDRLEIVTEQKSKDGTIKWLLKTKDKQLIETVYIPEDDRGTLCISSQVGCTLNCTFCHTGTQKLVKNLSVDEIIGQILVAKDQIGEWDQASDKKRLTNIVLMGMGEPLYNTDNVFNAMKIVMDGDGLAIGKRRITLSTSGIVPDIYRTGDEINVNLAISLHAVNDTLRDELVPINKKYPIAQLMDACRNYPGLSNSRRITFEYVMLKGVNDSLADAKGLVKLLKGIPAKINLIPFNPWPGTQYECSDWETIESFADYVNDCGYASPIRMPRGRDILAACGQLKSSSIKEKKSVLLKQQSQENSIELA